MLSLTALSQEHDSQYAVTNSSSREYEEQQQLE